MLHEVIPILSAAETAFEGSSRSDWIHGPLELSRQAAVDLAQLLDQLPEQPTLPLNPHAKMTLGSPANNERKEENEFSKSGHSLFQEMFFFCTVKKIADLPGSGCIYVETVVDRDSGVSFAKVYPMKNAANAVDILASRVLPFFKRQGVAVKEIHTRKTTEYCGLLAVQAFENFLVAAQIRHLPMEQLGQPCNYLCEEFYRLLLKDFFPAALRRTFPLSLGELQKDLDSFVDSHNAAQIKRQMI
jgi:hypothetical protein